MRIVYFTILLFTICGKALGQKQPKFQAEDKMFDYGTLVIGSEDNKRTVKFTNTGDAPLLISNVQSSCGCLVPVYWPNEPILPNQTDSIVIAYDTDRLGRFKKTITVTANEIEEVDDKGNNIYKKHILNVVGEVVSKDSIK